MENYNRKGVIEFYFYLRDYNKIVGVLGFCFESFCEVIEICDLVLGFFEWGIFLKVISLYKEW